MTISLTSKLSTNKTESSSISAPSKEATLSPTDRVVQVVKQLAGTMHSAIDEIREINENAKLLSLNARIEAARAGSSGAAFGVVAQEMQALSNKTANVADDMANKTQHSIEDLVDIIGGYVRGTRLVDIARNSIDLIDRNLYERTCDVRWWATDSSLVDALDQPSAASAEYASRRLGVILNAYTVYHDLVLCDSNGRVVANGRPNLYASKGRNESKAPWFSNASSIRNGDDFAFQSAHNSQLVGDQSVLIYAAPVRRETAGRESNIGVLGVIFNWSALSSAILANASLNAIESQHTLRLFMDEKQNVLACSSPTTNSRIPISNIERLIQSDKDYVLDKIDGKDVCIAQCKSQGFETYATGWYAVLIQTIA